MDTFRIKIKNYVATDPGYFSEIKSSAFTNRNHYKKDKTNNTYRNELTRNGIYVPKFSIAETDFGKPNNAFELEFSAGKLIYGTNLKETTEKDLPLIIDKLWDFSKSIKVRVDRREIENATVTLAAYTRNIRVDQFGLVQEILRVIAPFNYRPRSEYKTTSGEKGGVSMLGYFNNNSHLTLYDKLREIRNNPITKEECKIADYLRHGTNKEVYENWVKEILRVEVTFHSKTAVRQALSEFYGKKTDFTLTEAFSDNVRDTILRREINNVFNHPLQKILLLTSLDRDVFNQVIDKYCKTLAQRREMRIALDTFYTRGLNAYRKDVLSKASPRTWFRYQKRLKSICDTVELPRGITQINNAEFLEYFLSQFGIESKIREPEQMELF